MIEDQQANSFAPEIRGQLGLLRELNDVKRLYAFNLGSDSFATRIFRQASAAVAVGEPLHADVWCAAVVCAARLGAITPNILRDAGLNEEECIEVYERSIYVHETIDDPVRESLAAACHSLTQRYASTIPVGSEWVEWLATAPRAGATCPGKPRIALEPAEMHSDHSIMVAVYGYLLADLFGADREDAWLIGLCHHFHNAYLPDSGFTGEVMLGNHLEQILQTLRMRVVHALPECYRERVTRLFSEINGVATPLAMTFHAADTIDRVVQMEHYERSAQFRVRHALLDLNLVHEGAAQAFQYDLLHSIGLFPTAKP